MTTPQIVTISIIAIIALIGYFGTCFSEKTGVKIAYLALLTFSTFLFGLLAVAQTETVNELEKKLKNGCPEYEKIENVYILKK